MPAVGGAERFMVEALDALQERHSVQAVYLAPAPRPERYWEERRAAALAQYPRVTTAYA